VVLFSGHLANWEMLAVVPAHFGIRLSIFYRAATNPLVDAIIVGLRRAATGADVPMFAKGAQGARAAMAHLKAGGFLGMLIDQKMNDGIAAPLFGRPAMTAPAAAAFALRYRCTLVPAHVERLGPARFRLVVEAPLDLPDTGDRHADIAALAAAMNARLEGWIRARPGEWLWLHRRWPKELYL
jgi:KDO2-lipid IV(A) lauroyltransferase